MLRKAVHNVPFLFSYEMTDEDVQEPISIQSEMRRAREEFQARLFDEFRDAIASRNAGYLKTLHQEPASRNTDVLYVRLSLFVKK
jgi:hypothetical protein